MPAPNEIDRGDDFEPTGPDADPNKTPENIVTDADKKAVGVDDATLAAKAADAAKKAEDDAAAAAAAEAEKKGEGEGDKGEAGKRKDTRIPLARHEQLLQAERDRRAAVEAELARTKQADKIASTNEDIAKAETKLSELEAAHAKHVVDGDATKAAAVMGEIRKLERSIIQTQSAFEVQAAEARAYERVKYDTTVERLEAAYPQLNEDHADFNKELMAEVVELRNAYVATGKYSRADAIQKAVKVLVGAATTRQEAATTVDVRVDPDAVAKAAAEAAAATRTAAARAKAADAATKQPADLKKVGADSSAMGGVIDGKAVMKMKQEDFNKLDEQTLAKLRGDEIA